MLHVFSKKNNLISWNKNVLTWCPVLTGLNRKISYSLINSADGQFSINELSGIIQLEKPLDREVQAVYTLTLKAVDHGLPRRLTAVGTVVVSVLDINDNPPVFEYREYGATVSEDILIGTEVLQVYAASRDIEANAEITYSIISGNEHGKFSIDSKTGNRPWKWEETLGSATKARLPGTLPDTKGQIIHCQEIR